MKFKIFAILLLGVAFVSCAQDYKQGMKYFNDGMIENAMDLPDNGEGVVEEKVSGPVDEEICIGVEQMPKFPGGDAELMKWLRDHINYPTVAMKNNIEGRVILQLVVTKTGKVGEVKVVRSIDPDLDSEAVRLCKSLPDFIPGRKNGQAVNVWYTLPVQFKIRRK
jgi:protein TonB